MEPIHGQPAVTSEPPDICGCGNIDGRVPHTEVFKYAEEKKVFLNEYSTEIYFCEYVLEQCKEGQNDPFLVQILKGPLGFVSD